MVNCYRKRNATKSTQENKKLTDKLEEAKNRLQDGRGSLLDRVEKLKSIGRLSTKKELPNDVLDKNER